MRQFFLALIPIIFSVSALANVPPYATSAIEVPQLASSFVLGVTSYYLAPAASNNDLSYASINSQSANLKIIEPQSLKPANSF